MTPKQEAALRQALEALDGLYLPGELERVNKAIIALREALAEQSAPVASPHKQQEPVAWGEFVETACALIKAADDAAADRDYMLDSDDCIKVLRGTWSAPLANDQPSPPASKPWVGIDANDWNKIAYTSEFRAGADWAEAKLKERNA